MSDLAFEQLLAKYNDEFKDAQEYGGDWYPNDDTYLVSGSRLLAGGMKDGENCWWKPFVIIVDPVSKYYEREFPLGFYTTEAKKVGFTKALCRKLNDGQSISSRPEANEIFNKLADGMVLRVDVRTTISEKNGQEYTNCFVREVVAAEDVTADNSEPPQGFDGEVVATESVPPHVEMQ